MDNKTASLEEMRSIPHNDWETASLSSGHHLVNVTAVIDRAALFAAMHRGQRTDLQGLINVQG